MTTGKGARSGKKLHFIVRFGDRHRMWLRGTMDEMTEFLRAAGCTGIGEPEPIPEDDQAYGYADTCVRFTHVIRTSLPVIGYDYDRKERIVSDIRDVLRRHAGDVPVGDIGGITESYSFQSYIDALCEDRVVEKGDVLSVIVSYGEKAEKPYAVRNYTKVADASPDTLWGIMEGELGYGRPGLPTGN